MDRPDPNFIYPEKKVSAELFSALWEDLPDHKRWAKESIVAKGFECLWNPHEDCWWVIGESFGNGEA